VSPLARSEDETAGGMLGGNSSLDTVLDDFDRSDARAERRLMLITVAVVGGLFALATTTQSVMALGIFSQNLRGIDASPALEILTRGLINVGTVGVMLGGCAVLSPERRAVPGRILTVGGIAVCSALVRGAAQLLFGVYTVENVNAAAAELITTTAASVVTSLIALALVATWRRQRTEERTSIRSQAAALEAYRELRIEESRVRRDVAEEIHGTVQSSLVILEAQLLDIATTVSPDARERLAGLSESVRTIREEQLRSLSTRLFPTDFDRGLGAAIIAIVARMPPSVVIDDAFSDGAAELDARTEVSEDARLLIVRVIEEGVTNALRHGRATRIRIALSGHQGAAAIEMTDKGAGVSLDAVPSGLERLRRQLSARGGELTLHARDGAAGASLEAIVPLD